MNDALANIYQCTKHLFLYVDRDKFFTDIEFMSLSDVTLAMYKLINTYKTDYSYGYVLNEKSMTKLHSNKNYKQVSLPFSYYTRKYTNEDNSLPANDLIVGLYFPNNEIDDTIDIMINDLILSTIKITDKNKIYLPFADIYFLHQLDAGYKYKIRNNKDVSFYVVHMVLSSHNINIISKMPFLCYHKNEQTYGPSIEMNYPQIASAKVIQKAWRNYKKREYDHCMDNFINSDTIIEIDI